jgi:hypothetical protein
LEDPHTGERVGFRDAAELNRFLDRWVALLPPSRNTSDKENQP